MLSKPWCGWVEIRINGRKLGTASYLDWVPGLIITPLIRYLQRAKEDYEKWQHVQGGYGLNIEFDAEGCNFGLVGIGNRIYSYDDRGKEEPYIRIHEALCDYCDDVKFVRALLKEVTDDITENFKDWTWWDAVDEEERKTSEDELRTLLEEAKECLKSLEACGHIF